MSVCKITGQSPCKCSKNKNKVVIDSNDYRLALRKLFTDHAVYTGFAIIESLPVAQPNVPFVLARLLQNAPDIANLLEPIIGGVKANVVNQVITEHLKLAAATLEPVRNGETLLAEQAVNNFLAQGNVFADAVYSLNPAKLNQTEVRNMVRQHNDFVVQLVALRKDEKYAEFIKVADEYYKHMLMFSDALWEALS
jgi:hypothetical protein